MAARAATVSMRTEVELVLVECYQCGVIFGMTRQTERYYLDKGRRASFYCPNGHGQVYTKGLEDQLREERERAGLLQAELDRAQRRAMNAEEAVLDKAKELGRLKRRVHNGICPHCNRTFAQLGRHMKTKHPEAA